MWQHDDVNIGSFALSSRTDTQTRRSRHVEQSVQAEEVDLAAQEIGGARLSDAEQLGCFALGKTSTLDVFLERDHQP